jgi:hypothetical protein
LFQVKSFGQALLDEIDQALRAHYGFTDEKLDFIINYEIKCRVERAWR